MEVAGTHKHERSNMLNRDTDTGLIVEKRNGMIKKLETLLMQFYTLPAACSTSDRCAQVRHRSQESTRIDIRKKRALRRKEKADNNQ